MPFIILFSPAAKRDIQEAFDYYVDINPELGARFTALLNDRLEKLAITPLSGELRYEDVRCTLMRKFPYLIHYTVQDQEGKVIILRVFHTSQKPLWETEY